MIKLPRVLLTSHEPKDASVTLEMMGRNWVFVFAIFFSFKHYIVRQEMCKFNPKIKNAQTSRLTIVFAKSKIHSLKQGY